MDEEEAPAEMTFWGPKDGKMPKRDELLTLHATPFWLTGLFTDPKGVFRHDIEEGSLLHATVRVAGATILSGIMIILFFMALLSFIGAAAGSSFLAIANIIQDQFSASMVYLAIYLFIVLPISSVASFFIINGIIFAFARILGGSGVFGKQASATSLLPMLYVVIGVLLGIVYVPALALAMYMPPVLACVGVLYFVVGVALALFSVYISTIAISVSHGIDVLRSLLAIILSIAAAAILYAVVLSALVHMLAPASATPELVAQQAKTELPPSSQADLAGCDRMMESAGAANYDVSIRDQCYAGVAENHTDPGICEMMATQSWKDACYSQIGIDKSDPSLCAKVKNSDAKDSCYKKVASDTKDSSLCDRITDSGLQVSCRGLAQ